MNIYNITHEFYNDTCLLTDGHEKCRCSNYFPSLASDTSGEGSKIVKHYTSIKKIYEIYKSLKERFPKCTWLIDHTISYEGITTEFSISDQNEFIIYNESNIIVCIISPQLNGMNYKDIITKSIYKTWLVGNSKYINQRQEITPLNKKITTCIFTLDYSKPHYINWSEEVMSENKTLLNSIIKGSMEVIFKKHNTTFIQFIKWCAKESKKGCLVDFIREKLDEFAYWRTNAPEYIKGRVVDIENAEDDGEDIDIWIAKNLESRLLLKMNKSLDKFFNFAK